MKNRKDMTVNGEEIIYSGRRVDFKNMLVSLPDGKEGTRELACRKGNGNVVSALVENTDKDTYLFVEQFRVGVEKRVIELVAGITGDKGEKDIEEYMKEELREEMGYIAESVTKILTYPKSPGIVNEIGNIYYIKVRGERGKQDLENTENIRIIEIDKSEIYDFLEKYENMFDEGIMVSGEIRIALNKLDSMKNKNNIDV